MYTVLHRSLLFFRKFEFVSFFFVSLFHQRAYDEALTRFLQTSLFLVASPILVKSMFVDICGQFVMFMFIT